MGLYRCERFCGPGAFADQGKAAPALSRSTSSRVEHFNFSLSPKGSQIPFELKTKGRDLRFKHKLKCYDETLNKTVPEPAAFNPNAFVRRFLAVLLGLWLVGMTVLLVVGSYRDPEPGRLVVLFPLGYGSDQAFRAVNAADGLMIGGGAFGAIFTVESQSNEFADHIRKYGALALWRAEAFDWLFSSGCSGTSLPSLTKGA